MNGVLLKPLPYPHPSQLVALWNTAPGVNITDLNMSPSLYFIYSDENRVFQDVCVRGDGISYSVSQRTREIGIRLALGAALQEVTGMFVRDGLILSSIGAGCGLVTALVLTRLMKSLLFDVSPADPLTYIAVSAVLILAAMLASYLPARRATTVDPVEALRAE